MANTLKSEDCLENKLSGNPEDRPTFQAVKTDSDKLFDVSSLKITEATGEVAEETKEILDDDSLGARVARRLFKILTKFKTEKIDMSQLSPEMQKFFKYNKLPEKDIVKCISLIKQLGEVFLSIDLGNYEEKKLIIIIEELLNYRSFGEIDLEKEDSLIITNLLSKIRNLYSGMNLHNKILSNNLARTISEMIILESTKLTDSQEEKL